MKQQKWYQQSWQWRKHDQTVADAFPKKDSVQNGLTDGGIVTKVLKSMGDGYRVSFTMESRLTASTEFWISLHEGRRRNAVNPKDLIPTA